MASAQKPSLFDDFAEDLLEERSVRPLIIVGASKVDHLLREILSSHLLPKIAKKDEPDELLEGDRPLSTFSSRIKLCYRLGLIDKTMYTALEKLRERKPGRERKRGRS
jgi:DNA-binding MltR family transcriptional regulator